MKIDINKYKCNQCDIYKLNNFEQIYNNTYHCAACRFNKEKHYFKIVLRNTKLYKFIIRILNYVCNKESN